MPDTQPYHLSYILRAIIIGTEVPLLTGKFLPRVMLPSDLWYFSTPRKKKRRRKNWSYFFHLVIYIQFDLHLLLIGYQYCLYLRKIGTIRVVILKFKIASHTFFLQILVPLRFSGQLTIGRIAAGQQQK